MTYARRTDANHAEVLRALRSCGWFIYDTSRLPEFVDAIAVRRGIVRFVEIKDGTKAPSARKLTEPQKVLHADFQRYGVHVAVLTSVDDAIRLS